MQTIESEPTSYDVSEEPAREYTQYLKRRSLNINFFERLQLCKNALKPLPDRTRPKASAANIG